MAIPTIAAVTPATGSTRGRDIVRITGTNFRLPGPPPLTGPVQSDQQKTVSVKFEGVESEWAYSASSTLILARVPAYVGPYDITWPAELDVRVANLDDSEVEIPTENVTLADGYAMSRPDLSAECYLRRCIREVIKLFRIHLLRNTYHTTGRDFSLTPSLQKTLRSEGPLVQILGPRTPLNRFYSINQEDDGADPLGGVNGRMLRAEPITVDLVFPIGIWANNTTHLQALVQAYLLFHRDIKHVKVAVDPTDLSKGTKDYEFEPSWDMFPDMTTTPVYDDLSFAMAQSIVRGVHIDEDSGTIIERGWVVTQNDGYPVVEPQDL